MKIEYSTDNKFAHVESSTIGRWYDVTMYSCTCPDYLHRQKKVNGKCKHMIAAFFQLKSENISQIKKESVFEKGIDVDEAYKLFGDEKIEYLLNRQIIIEHKHKFIRLK